MRVRITVEEGADGWWFARAVAESTEYLDERVTIGRGGGHSEVLALQDLLLELLADVDILRERSTEETHSAIEQVRRRLAEMEGAGRP